MTTFTQAVAALAKSDKASMGKLASVAPLYLAEVKASDEKTANTTFRMAYMAAHSGKTIAQVDAWLADDTITKREGSTPMHLAYNAAKMALSRLRKLAGLAATGKAKGKPVAPPAAAEAVAPSPIMPQAFVPVRVNGVAEYLAQVNEYAVSLTKLQKANAKVALGDIGSILRDAVAEFVAKVRFANDTATTEEREETRNAA